ncbi:hypothetical protein Misp02_31120 [Microtetraspora sp. NBRC 16547]|nr:hypothetical protein Misp02_31120 [Microtetraspora sp. NBRC 16547]
MTLHGIYLHAKGWTTDACTEAQRAETPTAAEGNLKVALVCLLADAPVEEARIALQAADGRVRAALAELVTSRKEVP